MPAPQTGEQILVTALITRVEVAAAIARAQRMKIIAAQESSAALEAFRSEWGNFHRLPITETTVARADFLASEHNLRGYAATHLACALIWQEAVGLPVTLASFDQQLARAAKELGLEVLPNNGLFE